MKPGGSLTGHDPSASETRSIEPYRKVLRDLSEAVIITSAEGRVTFWNPAAQRLYGWRAEEAIGRNIIALTPAEPVRYEAAEIMARLMAGESWAGEFRVTHKDGTDFRAWVTDVPVLDAAGGVQEIIGVSFAMTPEPSAPALGGVERVEEAR